MIKNILLLLLSLMSLACFAQQADTAIVYTDIAGKITSNKKAVVTIYKSFKKDSNTYVFETFDAKNKIQKREYYSDSDLKIKHGLHLVFKNGKPVYKGFYINGRREGKFIRYDSLARVTEITSFQADSLNGPYSTYWSNGSKRSEGNYVHNQVVGTWIKYYKNGNVAIKETYNEGNIDVSKILDPKKKVEEYNRLRLSDSLFLDIDGLPTTRDKVEKKATYAGGMDKLYSFLSQNVRYPPDAMEKEIQGTVFISFTVNENGIVENLQIDKSPYPSLGVEAIRVMNLTKNWVPAVFGGENVSTQINIPIKFSHSY
jgi:TonB family protein